jgi:S1-C subfamily serine protease
MAIPRDIVAIRTDPSAWWTTVSKKKLISKLAAKPKSFTGAAHYPANFGSVGEAISQLKRSVYLIARGRQQGGQTQWVTLGSSFICGPGRLMTCAHVIEDAASQNPIARDHFDTDQYILLNHDDEDKFHYHVGSFKKSTDLTIHPGYDLAIINLPDLFYKAADGSVLRDKGDYIRISSSVARLGMPVGVLGYPLTVLTFDGQDIMKPKLGDVVLRADAGIVNARYWIAADKVFYDYTMAFNPGNSGGPVFDSRSGRAIAVVRGFRTIDINTREVQLPAGFPTTNYTLPAYISAVTASYSVGISLAPLAQLLNGRGINYG